MQTRTSQGWNSPAGGNRKAGKQQRSQTPGDRAAAPPRSRSIAAAAPTAHLADRCGRAERHTPPIGLQTIATAYSDYTMKSLEEARCFVEKLSGVRSLDKALEIQSEFARQAYETYAADSRKIRELYSDLVMKAFTPTASRRRQRATIPLLRGPLWRWLELAVLARTTGPRTAPDAAASRSLRRLDLLSPPWPACPSARPAFQRRTRSPAPPLR